MQSEKWVFHGNPAPPPRPSDIRYTERYTRLLRNYTKGTYTTYDLVKDKCFKKK